MMTKDAASTANEIRSDPHHVIHVGQDGWLFLTGGSNNVLAQYRSPGIPSEHFRYLRQLHIERTRWCRDRGARYYNVVVPEKLGVYDNKLDGLSIDITRAPAARIERCLRSSTAWGGHIDLLPPFRAERDRTQLYLKTDTHWSFAGCYLAYGIICRRMGVVPRLGLADPRHREWGPVTGDLGVKVDPHFSEIAEGWRFPRSAERVYANSLLRHFEGEGHRSWGGVGTHVIYRNEAPGLDPRTLVLCGDSYANHVWFPKIGALTVMLAETFREVHFFWATAVDWDYVERVRPAFVLMQTAERFMIELPPFGFDIAAFESESLARKIGRS